MGVIKYHKVSNDGHFKCKCCGKDEYVLLVVERCAACFNGEAKQDKQAALAAGLYKCEVCLKSTSWFRRHFIPRNAKHYVDGRHLCDQHKKEQDDESK